jgi:hypothetical protein
MVLGLSAWLVVGCQKKDTSSQVSDKGSGKDSSSGPQQVTPPGVPDQGTAKANTPGTPNSPPATEDPEVAAFVKKKGWSLFRDMRILDGKMIVVLGVQNRDKPFEDVALTPDDYKMIAKAKTVQLLDLRTVKATDDGLKTVADMPQLEGIIVKGDDVTDAGIRALAKCRSLDNVSLLFTKKVTDAGVKELAALPKLQILSLSGLTLTGSAFEPFAGSKTLKFVTLDYVDGLTDDGAKNLAKLPNLDALKIGRGFGETKLTAAGIKAIVDARLPAKFEFDKKLIDDSLLESLVKKGWLYGPTPPGVKDTKPATAEEVKYVSLGDSKITDKGLATILNCTNLTYLDLNGTGVTDEGVKKLTAFKKLNELSLKGAKVTGVGLEAISGLLLRRLAMEGCELSEDAFKAFGKMTTLEQLWLTNTKMKAEWLKHIATLPQLKELTLMGADFDDEAVKHVTTMPSLQDLTLNFTKLGDTGFQKLVKLPKLQALLVDGTKVSKEVYLKAKKDHPKLRLYFYSYDK